MQLRRAALATALLALALTLVLVDLALPATVVHACVPQSSDVRTSVSTKLLGTSMAGSYLG